MIRTAYAGTISVRASEIIEMETSAPVKVYLCDNTEVTGILRKGPRNAVQIVPSDPKKARVVVLDEIAGIGVSPGSERTLLMQTMQFAKPQADLTGADAAPTAEAPSAGAPAGALPTAQSESEAAAQAAAQATAEAEAKKLAESWQGFISAGMSFISGNTDKNTANTTVQLSREINRKRFGINARYHSSEENDSMTERRAAGNLKADFFLSDTRYLYATEEIKYDQFKDLDLQAATGVGYGWKLLQTPHLTFEIESGVTHIFERYENTPNNDYLAGRLSAKAGVKLTERIELKDAVIYYPSFEDWEYQLYNELQLHYKMDQHWGFQVLNVYEFDSSPSAKNSKTDSTTTFGVRYSF